MVFPTKYRRAVFDDKVDLVLWDICLEIGVDKNPVHFLLQSVPIYSVTKLVRVIKSITGREIFKACPHVKKQLWGGEFWSDGFLASTVGKHGDETTIANYVKNQGGDNYVKLHESVQSELF